MTKSALVIEMGKPAVIRNSVKNKHGQLEDIWQYTVTPTAKKGRDVTRGVLKRGFGFFRNPSKDNKLLFHFIDERLARWGRKGKKSRSKSKRRAKPRR